MRARIFANTRPGFLLPFFPFAALSLFLSGGRPFFPCRVALAILWSNRTSYASRVAKGLVIGLPRGGDADGRAVALSPGIPSTRV